MITDRNTGIVSEPGEWGDSDSDTSLVCHLRHTHTHMCSSLIIILTMRVRRRKIITNSLNRGKKSHEPGGCGQDQSGHDNIFHLTNKSVG